MKPVIRIRIFSLLAVPLVALASCNNNVGQDEEQAETKTPVKVVTVSREPMMDIIELNAITEFQVKDNIKSPVNGYVKSVEARPGDYVKAGQLLFTVQTKDASALAGRSDDTTLQFSGIVNVISSINGIVTSLSVQDGDYVQDGDELAVVAVQSSLVFILEVPFELRKYMRPGMSCNIILPGDETIRGILGAGLPVIDEISQTQKYILRPISSSVLPENLIAKAEIVKSVKDSAQTLPKGAVLTDETQSQWWIMKLINDSVTVKVPIVKGIESKGKVEIVEPEFNGSDRIVVAGGYGLPDTAKVEIEK